MTQDFLQCPFLGLSGKNVYQRKITDGLWVVLTRARLIATHEKSQLENRGQSLKVELKALFKSREYSADCTTFVIYHVPFDKNKNVNIRSFDVPTIDHSRIDHTKLVSESIRRIHNVYKNARVILCTSPEFGLKLKDSGAEIIIPKVDKERPMYYRALTYNTLIQEDILSEKTVFIDSDALILRPLDEVFEFLNFDIAVTARFAPNLMPINEGVIMARGISTGAKRFFAHYMGYKFILIFL